jgi:hypothetical protein
MFIESGVKMDDVFRLLSPEVEFDKTALGLNKSLNSACRREMLLKVLVFAKPVAHKVRHYHFFGKNTHHVASQLATSDSMPDFPDGVNMQVFVDNKLPRFRNKYHAAE